MCGMTDICIPWAYLTQVFPTKHVRLSVLAVEIGVWVCDVTN